MQKEKRKTQLQAKTQSHVAMQKQNAILKTQQKLLDKAYAGAVEKLSTLPDEKVEPIFRACLKDIKVKGAIYPAAKHASLLKKLAPSEQFSIEAPIEVKGGFRFVSEKIEEDCTFEYLVENVLRPRTELATAQSLFA
jgi:vacuolar-type H+-ATPase subunit E/Vma4